MRLWGRESFFVSLAVRMGERLGQASLPRVRGESLYDKLDARFHRSTAGRLCGDGYDRMGWQYRLRRYGMHARENSLFLSLRTRVADFLFKASIGYAGLYFLMTGISLLILVLIVDEMLADGRQLLISLGFIFLSVPLLMGSKSVATVIGESFFARRLLTGFCGISFFLHVPTEKGEARPMSVLLFSAISVALAGILTPLVFFRLLLLLALMIVLLSSPEVNLPLLFFSFPFLQWTSHPTLILCGLVLTFEISWAWRAFCGRRDFEFEIADAFLLSFCFCLLCGSFLGYGNAFCGLALSLLAFSYLPMKHLLLVESCRRRTRAALTLGAALCATFGIFQYFFLETELLWVDRDRFFDIGSRVCSFFDNPNILAVYLLSVFPIALCGAFDRSERALHRCFFGLAAFTMAFCTVLTWSRGAWLGLLLEVLLVLLFYGKYSFVTLFFSLPLVLLSVPFLPSNVIRRFLSIGNLAESSIRYRLYTWRGVLRMIAEHPYGIGIGEEAFRAVYPRYALPGIETVMHAHNLLLQTVSEVGIVGGILLLCGVLLSVLKGFGRRRASGAPYALCGVAVMGMFDHLWYAPGMILIFFSLLAFSLVEEDL